MIFAGIVALLAAGTGAVKLYLSLTKWFCTKYSYLMVSNNKFYVWYFISVNS